MNTTLLLAQDCALLRSGIRRTLDVASGIEIVAETGTASELLTLARRTRPDAVLLGLEMHGSRGGSGRSELLVFEQMDDLGHAVFGDREILGGQTFHGISFAVFDDDGFDH